MEQKNFPFLRNWNLSSNQSDIIITGSVYGHQHIADSRKINTSPVQKVAFSRESWDRLYFYTHNTVYECPLNQVDPTCQFTKKYLLDSMPHEHETWDKWLNDDPTRPETPFESVDLPVPDGSYLLALDADSPHLFHGVYQKFGNKYHWIIRSPYVNMGMYTDSVLCNKYDEQLNLLFDVRYFPQGAQKLRFYDIEFGGPNVLFYVVNVGQSSIYYDGNTLKYWHYFQLLEKNKEEIHPPEPEPPVEELNSVIRPNEPRPPLPSRLQNGEEIEGNQDEIAEIQGELGENNLATLENREENPEEAIPDHALPQSEWPGETLEEVSPEYQAEIPDSEENMGENQEEYENLEENDGQNQEEYQVVPENHAENPTELHLETQEQEQTHQEFSSAEEIGNPPPSANQAPLQFEIQPEINFRPENPPESMEIQGELVTEAGEHQVLEENQVIAQQMAEQIQLLQAQASWNQGESPETPVENGENQVWEGAEDNVENPEEQVPRKSLLEEALELEESSIPRKNRVEYYDEEESREQVLFSSLALYGVALEEIALEPNESGAELADFDEVPVMNLDFFPDADQEDIAQLNLGKTTEYD